MKKFIAFQIMLLVIFQIVYADVNNATVYTEYTTPLNYVINDNLKTGDSLYIDDTVLYNDVNIYSGQKYIQTASSNRLNEHNYPFLEFDLTETSTVSVAVSTNLMITDDHWLLQLGFLQTNDYITATKDTASYKYRIWKRKYNAGKVKLGASGVAGTLTNSLMMYVVFIKAETQDNGVYPNKEISSPYSSIPAFPGAKGAGMYATGGRGGEVYIVNTLLDYLSTETPIIGSLRDAVSKGNRTIIFSVSGNIELKENLTVNVSNITIAGQSSPGGICLKNYSASFLGNNMIVRFIRFRPGDQMMVELDAAGGYSRSLGIIDHVSAEWGVDENLSLYRMTDFTIQWSIVAESNFHSVHESGCHAFGGIDGGNNFSYINNLLAHNVSRNTRFGETINAEFINNVIYNWGYKCIYGDWDNLNFINNYFKYGPSTGSQYKSSAIEIADVGFLTYMKGNYIDGDTATTNDNWRTVYYKNGATREIVELPQPVTIKNLNGQKVNTTPVDTKQAYNDVLSFSGANVPYRDNNDTRIVNDVYNRTGNSKYTIDPIDPITGLPTQSVLPSGTVVQHNIDEYNRIALFNGVKYIYQWDDYSGFVAKKDSNNDGIPDEWCLKRGLNPFDNNVTNGDYTGDGYTNIEKYLNDLTINAFPAGTVTKSPEKTIYTVPTNEYELSSISIDNLDNLIEKELPKTTVSGYKVNWESSNVTIQNNAITKIIRDDYNDKYCTLKAVINIETGQFEKNFTGVIKSNYKYNVFNYVPTIGSTYKISSATDVSLGIVGDAIEMRSKKLASAGYFEKTFTTQALKGDVVEAGFKFLAGDIAKKGTLTWETFESDTGGDIGKVLMQSDENNKLQFKVIKEGSSNDWGYITTISNDVFKISTDDKRYYEIKCVVDFKNTFSNGVNTFNPRHDYYILQDGNVVASFKSALRNKMTSMYLGRIYKMKFQFSSVDTDKCFYLKDIYVNDLSKNVKTSYDNLNLTSNVDLPKRGLNSTNIKWDVSSNIYTATIYKGDLFYTNDALTKNFSINSSNAPKVGLVSINLKNSNNQRVASLADMTKDLTVNSVFVNELDIEKKFDYFVVMYKDNKIIKIIYKNISLKAYESTDNIVNLTTDDYNVKIKAFLWENQKPLENTINLF